MVFAKFASNIFYSTKIYLCPCYYVCQLKKTKTTHISIIRLANVKFPL